MRKLLVVALGVLAFAAPAAAQDKPVDVNIGFGWSFPLSGFKDSFDTGWNGGIGATYNLNPHLGIQTEYMYHRQNGPDRVIPISSTPVGAALTNGLIESNHQMHVVDFNVVYKAQSPDRPLGGYFLAGLGYYHRIIQLTTPSVGYTTICDPYWLVCYPGYVSIDRIIGDRSSNDFGMDFGGGITFGHEAKFYVETRYHYVWGPTIKSDISTLPSGATATEYSTNEQFLPLTFGVRW